MADKRFSVNSYTFHELLGVDRRPSYSADGAILAETVEQSPAEIRLLDLPAMLARHGIGSIDLCFNHLPSTGDEYLEKLYASFQETGVDLFCLLLDYGNLTLPNGPMREAEFAYVSKWIHIARRLGERCIRVQAGDRVPGDPSTPAEIFERVVEGYQRLADVAGEAGVRLLTENFGGFLLDIERLLELLERLDGRLGLVADFGNGRCPGEYEALGRLLERAESVHAKPELDAKGDLLEDDFRTCVRLAQDIGFPGPYTLVYRGPLHPFSGLERTRALVLMELERPRPSAASPDL